jgi:hypothetical protein
VYLREAQPHGAVLVGAVRCNASTANLAGVSIVGAFANMLCTKDLMLHIDRSLN